MLYWVTVKISPNNTHWNILQSIIFTLNTVALLLRLLLNLIRSPPIIQIHLMSVPLLRKSNNYESLPTNTRAQRCLKPLTPLFFIQDPLLLTCTGNSLFLFCMKYCENPVRGLPSRLIPQYLQARFPPSHSAGIMLCHCSHYLHSLLIVHLICLSFSAQFWIIKKSHCTRFNQILDHICHPLYVPNKKTHQLP